VATTLGPRGRGVIRNDDRYCIVRRIDVSSISGR
jgi:hypothetical protein